MRRSGSSMSEILAVKASSLSSVGWAGWRFLARLPPQALAEEVLHVLLPLAPLYEAPGYVSRDALAPLGLEHLQVLALFRLHPRLRRRGVRHLALHRRFRLRVA